MKPPPPIGSAPTHRMGLAISSLVLGIVALFLSLVVVGIIFGVVGLILGAIHILNKRGPTAMAWWGMALSVFAIVASVGLGLAYFHGFKFAKTYFTSVTEAFQHQSGDTSAGEWEGVIAPDISVRTLDAQTINLSQLKGKRVVLVFWATSSGPSEAQIAHLNKLHQETSRQELVIVGISREDEATLKPFVKKKAVLYPIASATGLPSPYGEVQIFPTTFFIDRNGVIQSVAMSAGDFNQLKTAALAQDFEGAPAEAPAPAPSGLVESETMLAPVELWSTNLPGAEALCAGDWDQDGTVEVLVLDNGEKLQVLGLNGKVKRSIRLPGQFSAIECGRHQSKGVRLLGYVSWDRKVTVMDGAGKEIWSYAAGLGVDGAHWGDLDGDGTDELVVGMNGFGGLHAVSAEGKQLWRAAGLANVWSQAIIPAAKARSALVFATEAGGSVQVLDGKGAVLRVLRPKGKYCTQLSAAVMDEATVQIIAYGQDQAIVFDENGGVAWASPSLKSQGATENGCFASGDVDSNGIREWAFLDPVGDIVIASMEGKKLASVAGAGSSNFIFVPEPSGRHVLVTLGSGKVTAYAFKAE